VAGGQQFSRLGWCGEEFPAVGFFRRGLWALRVEIVSGDGRRGPARASAQEPLPRTRGLTVSLDTSNSTRETVDSQPSASKAHQNDPDLQRVIDAWGTLPERLKRAMVAMLG
jgi:hypothetical protein